MRSLLVVIVSLIFIFSCSKEGESNIDNTSAIESCSNIEASLDSHLAAYSTDADFSFYLEKEDGHSYSFNRGTSTLDTVYDSASTSKWVSAAIILWTQSRHSGFDLNDIVSDHYSWSMPIGESVYNATLSQLLSFTSGLKGEASCLRLGIPSKSFDDCINDSNGSIVSENTGEGHSAGSSFYYSSSHLQLAGAMAIEAGGYTDWQNVFSDFKSQTGLFTNSTYSLPSPANPRLAGGMTWTTRDYAAFLKALYHNSFMSESLRSSMFTDRIGNLPISYSPAFDGVGEQWHYGYGVWLECESSTYNCSTTDYYSSPGAYGAYPFINLNKKFFGIVGREGALGTYANGVNLYRSARMLSEKWSSCTN